MYFLLILYFLPLIVALALLFALIGFAKKAIKYVNDFIFTIVPESFFNAFGFSISSFFDVYTYLVLLMAFFATYYSVFVLDHRPSPRHPLVRKRGFYGAVASFIAAFFKMNIIGQLGLLFSVLFFLFSAFTLYLGVNEVTYIFTNFIEGNLGEAMLNSFFSAFWLGICLFITGLLFSLAYCSTGNSNALDFFSSHQRSFNEAEVHYGAGVAIGVLITASIVLEHHFGSYSQRYLSMTITKLVFAVTFFSITILCIVSTFLSAIKKQPLSRIRFYYALLGLKWISGVTLYILFLSSFISVIALGLMILNEAVLNGWYFAALPPLLFYLLVLYFLYHTTSGALRYVEGCTRSILNP